MKTLKQWCIENQELELLKFYENAKNIKNSDEISYSSPKEVNWKCPVCKIEWKQSPNKMMHRKEKDCAYCTHKKPSYFYNLKTEYLLLAEEWDYDKNKKVLQNIYLKVKKVYTGNVKTDICGNLVSVTVLELFKITRIILDLFAHIAIMKERLMCTI